MTTATNTFTPRTDDLYDLLPLDDVDLFRTDICTPDLYALAHVGGWEPYIPDDLPGSTFFPGLDLY